MIETELFRAPDVFRALGDPTRRAVYERLTGGERSVGELTAGMGVSQPAVSQHLAALKAAGLVGERRDGRRTYYRIEPVGLAPLIDWLGRYRAFWPTRIERLKDILKEMDQ
jgi:DNA-binding transcriptional ArsR family regulator